MKTNCYRFLGLLITQLYQWLMSTGDGGARESREADAAKSANGPNGKSNHHIKGTDLSDFPIRAVQYRFHPVFGSGTRCSGPGFPVAPYCMQWPVLRPKKRPSVSSRRSAVKAADHLGILPALTADETMLTTLHKCSHRYRGVHRL